MPDVWNQWQQHKLATNLMKEDPNTRDYHQMGGHDFMQRFPNTPDWLGKGLATGYQLASEFGKGILNPSRMSSFLPRALEEARLNRLGIEGLTPDQQARYDSFSKTFDPTIESMYPTDRSSGIWNAIKSEFGGSAEAADLSDMIPKDLEKTIEEGMKRRPQAGQRRSGIPRRDTWNQYQLTERGPFGGPFGYMGYTNQAFKDKNFAWENLIKGGDYIPGADLNKAHREMMNKKMRSYSEGETIPSEYPYADMIKTAPYMPDKLPLQIGPYKGSRYATTDMKNIGFGQWYKQQQHKKMSQAKKNAAMHQQIQQAEVAAAQQAAAQQVRQNIRTYGNRDRPNTGINRPGGGRGRSPTGGDIAGTPFNQGGLVSLWRR